MGQMALEEDPPGATTEGIRFQVAAWKIDVVKDVPRKRMKTQTLQVASDFGGEKCVSSGDTGTLSLEKTRSNSQTPQILEYLGHSQM